MCSKYTQHYITKATNVVCWYWRYNSLVWSLNVWWVYLGKFTKKHFYIRDYSVSCFLWNRDGCLWNTLYDARVLESRGSEGPWGLIWVGCVVFVHELCLCIPGQGNEFVKMSEGITWTYLSSFSWQFPLSHNSVIMLTLISLSLDMYWGLLNVRFGAKPLSGVSSTIYTRINIVFYLR